MNPESLLLMIPTPLLAALIMWFVKREFNRFEVIMARFEKAIERQSEFATRESLTNLGDRFQSLLSAERKEANALIADLRERVRVLESK